MPLPSGPFALGTLAREEVGLLHLRLIAPVDRSREVVELLSGDAAVTHLLVFPGAAIEPPGDVVMCDVAREGMNAVLTCLRDLGLERDGAITIEQVDVSLSKAAEAAEKALAGHALERG